MESQRTAQLRPQRVLLYDDIVKENILLSLKTLLITNREKKGIKSILFVIISHKKILKNFKKRDGKHKINIYHTILTIVHSHMDV